MRSYLRPMEPLCAPATLPCSLALTAPGTISAHRCCAQGMRPIASLSLLQAPARGGGAEGASVDRADRAATAGVSSSRRVQPCAGRAGRRASRHCGSLRRWGKRGQGRTVQLALPGHSVVPLPGPGFVPQTVSTAGDSSDEGGEFLQ